MKVCFPVQQDVQLDSDVFGHFGSAPAFVVVDTESNEVTTIRNGDRLHAHGACNPLKALDNQRVDAVVVGGIGGGALSRLNQAGVRVYRARPGTIRANLALLRENALPEYALSSACGGHGHGHGNGGACAHH